MDRRGWATLVWLVCMVCVGSGFNITTYLSKHPDLATFNNLLTATNVAGEINNRSSLTILALSNTQLEPFISSFGGNLPTQEVSDVLRYHVLLEYLDWDRLQQMTMAGTLVTTLYQTTGRAPGNTGAVNITTVSGQVRIGMPIPGAGYNSTIVGLVDKFPYVVSIARISSMILPFGFDLSGSPAPTSVGFNVTDALVKANNFNFFVSLMEASGVVYEFQSEEAGAGITIFAPTDDAFSALNPETLQGLTADKKALILKYHVLLSYYPLGSLQTIVNPVQPTLATQAMGASSYTLNITQIHGDVAVNTGIVQAPVTETVFDQKPLAIFAVPKVLLPREIFGSKTAPTPSPAPAPANFPFQSPGPSPFTGISQPPISVPAFPKPPISIPAFPQPPISVPAFPRQPISVPPAFSPFIPPVTPFLSPSFPPIRGSTAPSPSIFAARPATPPSTVTPTPMASFSPPPFPSMSTGTAITAPSPSPFLAGVGKISSAAPVNCIVGTAVLGFMALFTVNLLLENV
ncbi:hypothetical protein SUGI_0921740 [Cryptomeria japonica]|uniref:fasciclin-like arabinogalactan protein 4 n=1 Tax=Cryptomeria japonica TaxID=3369 RepID=UPI002414C52D|nr:fasciclin-like arabinogalactan protein 4 [Cryptomeria japonica]GLJ44171.1 hypothetical protein SUGI_0921740 [Cryptomeria japonica]